VGGQWGRWGDCPQSRSRASFCVHFSEGVVSFRGRSSLTPINKVLEGSWLFQQHVHTTAMPARAGSCWVYKSFHYLTKWVIIFSKLKISFVNAFLFIVHCQLITTEQSHYIRPSFANGTGIVVGQGLRGQQSTDL
jgi:hypothetical protein